MKIQATNLSIVLVMDSLQISYMFGISLKINGYKNDLSLLNYEQLFDEANYVWKHLLNDYNDKLSKLLIFVDSGKIEQNIDAWHSDLSKFVLEKVAGSCSRERKFIRICYLASDRSELVRIQSSLSKEATGFSLPYGVVERPVTIAEVSDLIVAQSMLMEI